MSKKIAKFAFSIPDGLADFMTAEEIKEIVRCGETSTVQFKLTFKKNEDVANELVAFSNSNVGRIFVGINDKTGEIVGLSYEEVQAIGTLCAKTMDYRGLGSGIIRALKADANIEFRNEASGDQFRAILWRTTQKSNHNPEGSEKIGQETTQETENTTQKTDEEYQGKEKTTQKIVSLMAENPNISIEKLAELCEMTRDGINWQIRKLKESGKIRRVGPDKGGHWEVL